MSLYNINKKYANYFHIWHVNPWTHDGLWTHVRFIPNVEGQIYFEKTLVKFFRLGHVLSMHKVLLKATKATFAFGNFNVVSVDEITTIDNMQWLSIHLYVVHGWKRIMILLCVEVTRVSTTSDNVFKLMVKGLLEFGGLRFEELVGKLVSMECDGSNIFQDHWTCVTL